MKSKEEILEPLWFYANKKSPSNKEVCVIEHDQALKAMDEYWNVGYEAGKKETAFKISQAVIGLLETHSPYNDPNFFHIHLMETINKFKK